MKYRKRYVALTITPEPRSRRELQSLLKREAERNGLSYDEFRLLKLHGDKCIVLCEHAALNVAMRFLNGRIGDYRCSTILTSGTLRALRRKARLPAGL